MVFHMRWISQSAFRARFGDLWFKNPSHMKKYIIMYILFGDLLIDIYRCYCSSIFKVGYGLEIALMKYIPEHLNASDGLS